MKPLLEHQACLTRREFFGRSALGLGAVSLFQRDAFAAEATHPFDLRPQPWQRRDEPILSARTTKESWCKVVCYSPHVVFHEGKFRMWYLGTSTESRSGDTAMGYAESADGVAWEPHPGNPIFTGKDVGWGDMVQTPFVLFDREEAVFKLWFVSGKAGLNEQGGSAIYNQHLGYATSGDGIRWKVHPEPLYPSGRSPSVIKEGPGRYRMWMGSIPAAEQPEFKTHGNIYDAALYQNIYEFRSSDGIQWKREPQPMMRPSGRVNTVVYPFVLNEGGTWYLWHGGHVAGGQFEIFCATSKDGKTWEANHEEAAFAARTGKTAFDSRYTSIPRVVSAQDRWLLYYSARDWQTDYIDSEGRKRRDNSSPYSHIGVAVIPKPSR